MGERTANPPCEWRAYIVTPANPLELELTNACKIKVYNDYSTDDNVTLDVELRFNSPLWDSSASSIPASSSQTFDVSHMAGWLSFDFNAMRPHCIKHIRLSASDDCPCRLSIQRLP